MANFLTNILDSFSGANAIRSGGDQNQAFLQQGIDEITAGAGRATDALNVGRNSALTAITGGGAFDPAAFGQGLTLQGFGQSINDILSPTGALAPLIQERQQAATNALGAAGLTRSSVAAEQAAAIPFETALQLENLLFGRQAGVANQVGQLEQGFGSNIANLETGTSASLANLLAAIGESKANTASGAAGARNSAIGTLVQGGAALAGLFSDERLKTNFKEISRDGEFTFYTWDWIPEIREIVGHDAVLVNFGLIAQDVQRIAPEYVGEVGDYLAIDYNGLMEDERWSLQ